LRGALYARVLGTTSLGKKGAAGTRRKAGRHSISGVEAVLKTERLRS
jgi:hypothetical protein